MTISAFDVAKALRDQLAANAMLPVAYEGAPYAPDADAPYLKEHFMPAATRTVGLANDDADDATGIYQVDVCSPVADGKWYNLAQGDTVAGYFPKGWHLTRNGHRIVVLDVSRTRVRNEGPHLASSLTIRWRVVK